MIPLCQANPFVRTAMIQDTVMEGDRPRKPYDHRIFLILEGNAIFILNGQELHITENSLIYLGIKDEYFFKGKVRAVVINFDMTMSFHNKKTAVCPVPSEYYNAKLIFDKTETIELNKPLVITADLSLRNDILALVQTYIVAGTFSEAQCSAMMKKLLVDMLININEYKDTQQIFIDKILRYIRDNAATITSNEDLGIIFGYHHVYLAEIFKKHTGETLHTIVLKEKLRIASRWLTYTNETVEKIACEVGFSSRNHFCTSFKKHFGCTPLSYRKKAKFSII